MAKELLENEQMIKNQEGPYRPQFNPVTRKYEPVIKCWPLTEYSGGNAQQRGVIPGMENEVDDICMAKIDNGTISYKVNRVKWCPSFNPFTRVIEQAPKMRAHSILVYTPTFENDTIFLTADGLDELYDGMREYHIVNETEDNDRKNGKEISEHLQSIDDWFKKFQGICTYILFEGEDVVKCGKFDNKKYW